LEVNNTELKRKLTLLENAEKDKTDISEEEQAAKKALNGNNSSAEQKQQIIKLQKTIILLRNKLTSESGKVN